MPFPLILSNVLRLIHLISIFPWLPGSLELNLMLNNPYGLNLIFVFYEIHCIQPQFKAFSNSFERESKKIKGRKERRKEL